MEDRKFIKNAILIGLFSWAVIALVIWLLSDLSIGESGYAAITPVIFLSVFSIAFFGFIVRE
jgi:hypothetical protein